MIELVESLDQLAFDINERFRLAEQYSQKSDDHRIAAGKHLAEVRKRLPQECPDVAWTAWVLDNVKRSYRDVQRCLQLAQAPDPQAAHAAEKRTRREQMARTREKRRGGTHVGPPDKSPDDGSDADLRVAVLALPKERLAAFRAWLIGYCAAVIGG